MLYMNDASSHYLVSARKKRCDKFILQYCRYLHWHY